MKFIKDFIYDKNDLVIALLVLAFAICIIAWRMDVIMNYPQVLAEQTGTNIAQDDSKEKDGKGDESTGIWSGKGLAKEITVTIPQGSATEAAQALIDAGIFKSYDEFEEICKSVKQKAVNINATTFTFKKGTTKEEIAKIVTA